MTQLTSKQLQRLGSDLADITGDINALELLATYHLNYQTVCQRDRGMEHYLLNSNTQVLRSLHTSLAKLARRVDDISYILLENDNIKELKASQLF
ncbi:hypothetical protein [Streptococcus halichoeri]|uniref:hypothetical protein n=1 Tax=Streptococcus halichoeri TaxID=254785 RepID=UPI001C8EE843|nr:hypothetical protein [Streptococcus halichoeri]